MLTNIFLFTKLPSILENKEKSKSHIWASLVAQMVKNLPANAGDLGSIPGEGRSPGEGNSNPLQYSCLGSSTEGGTWQATVHGVTWVGHD